MALFDLQRQLDCKSIVVILWCDVPPVLTRFIFPSEPLCLGVCIGEPQAANLGDGHGLVNQTFELRQGGEDELEIIDRDSPFEDPSGVNYLRLFRQNGPTANTGALFLAYVCPVLPSRLFFCRARGSH